MGYLIINKEMKSNMELNKESFIIDNWYGGKQEWLWESSFTSKKNADRSCGVASAANVIHYLSRENLELGNTAYGNSKDDFIELMKELFILLKPRFYGIPTVGKMKRGILNFFANKDINLKANSKIWIFNQKDKGDFIKKAILGGNPVLILTWDFKDPQFKNHWVTLTGWQGK